VNYLLDTNVVSEPRKREPNNNVLKWLKQKPAKQLFISNITIAEISLGKNNAKTPEQQEAIAAWLEYRIKPQYHERILPITTEIAEIWGQLISHPNAVQHQSHVFDLFIAVTAIVHDLTVVTRNIKHFEPFLVTILNPWEDTETQATLSS
jgi:toxin FitB